jgi:hypothetical protein
MQVNRELKRIWQLQRIQMEGVTRAAESVANYENTFMESLDWEGQWEGLETYGFAHVISNNYQDFFGLKLRAGRWFSAANTADE